LADSACERAAIESVMLKRVSKAAINLNRNQLVQRITGSAPIESDNVIDIARTT
jgi:hypothetical protein